MHTCWGLIPLGCVFAGSVLQIVSAPGQPYLRAPGPVVMQTVSQAGAVHGALGSKPPTGGPSPTPVTPQGRVFWDGGGTLQGTSLECLSSE